MLDALKKKLGIAPVTEDQQQMSNDTNRLSADASEIQALQASLNAARADLETATNLLEELQTEALLAKAEAEKAQNQVKAMKMAARKTAVEDIVGTEKAESFLSATELLNDAAFANVVSTLAGSVNSEASTALFKEVGVDAKADTSKLEAVSKEMELLKKRYAANSAK